jgi:hypothetical protein
MSRPAVRSPWCAQILVGLKSADPTALTAEEAVRHLLGFDDRLLALERRVLHELTCVPAAPDPAAALENAKCQALTPTRRQATAWQAMASPRPSSPRPSWLLALTLTRSTGTPKISAAEARKAL